MNFLIVDDMQFDRAMLAHCVTSMGFLATSTANEEEMFAACQKTMPDCILLDWELGTTTGIKLLQKLRVMEGGGKVVIFICTSNSHPSFIGHAHTQGANDLIIKPITKDKLTIKLQEFNLL